MSTLVIHRLTTCVLALGMFIASEANAADAPCHDCAVATINANIQVAKLHPSVTAVQLVCNLRAQITSVEVPSCR